ncbi:TRAP transporter substrate-binding protein [Desertibaculum subflavum]|uniref:TRAP transporter substrate-binding protein n=1 Tax=Desertibaculum subflavum TaxID=2268458 RepID=UPI000E6705FB
MKTWIATALLTGAALVALPAAAQTKWDLPAAYPATNFHTVNLQKFADTVKGATGGKLVITVHANGSLYKANEIKRAVQTGQAQIGEVLMVNLQNEDPAFGADGVPFLTSDYASSKKLAAAQRPVVAKKLDAQGMTLLYTCAWPGQGIYAKRELNSVKDMEGLKWRAYSPQTSRLAELVKAQPITIQAAELSQALATGKVDSFASSGATGVDSKVWEQLTHFYALDGWQPKNMVIVNKAALSKLDKSAQDAIAAAAKSAETSCWAESEKLAQGFLDTLAKNGMKVQKASPKFAAELNEIGKTMTEEWLKVSGADGKAIVDAYRK